MLCCQTITKIIYGIFLKIKFYFALVKLAEVEKQQLLKQQQNQKNSKSVRELERINRVS